MTTLLLVDDDAHLRTMLRIALSDEGYSIIDSPDAETALYELSQHAVHIALVDIRLPGMNGLDLCREVRRRTKTPIVVVTAQTGSDEVVAALEAGADDCVAKPIDMAELKARLRSLLRRMEGELAPALTVRIGDVVVHAGEDRVERAGDALPLTPLEARLLGALAERPGTPIRREELVEHGWASESVADLETVDSVVDGLRRGLEACVERPRIVPVLGEGYRLDP